MKIRKFGLARLLALFLVCTPLAAQDPTPRPAMDDPNRPKIGLALGGGGAKGGAHVGVLKVMEELNIPIDYIAGTSIGAIVGGLYASGMTADELGDALANIDWGEALKDKPPRTDLTFRRKEDDARYIFDLEVGIGKGGIKWPSGLVSGQNLFFLLQSMTIPVAEIDDFDRLPIPFRAVATDVNSGEMVVLDHGYLASAMRASMAIPGFFAPMELQGKLLVDGGLVNNLPVDVVQEMGADIVIAVDLGAPLAARQVGQSILQIYAQTIRMLTRPNVEPRLEAADLVINPGVENFGTMGFKDIDEIMRMGEENARTRIDDLSRYSVEPVVYQAHRAKQFIPDAEPVHIDFVDFVGNERVDDRIVDHQVRLEAGEQLTFDVMAEDIKRLLGSDREGEKRIQKEVKAGKPLDLGILSADLRRLYGLGDFELIDFKFERREEEQGIVIRMREKPWGPHYLHFGMELTTDFEGETTFTALINVTSTRLTARGGEWRNDLGIGRRRGIFSEFYQPLDFAGKFFVAPRASLESRRPFFYEEGQRIAELDVDMNTLGLDFGYQTTVFGELRLGVLRQSGSASLETGTISPGTVPELNDFDVGGVRFLARGDRLDSVTIPHRGLWTVFEGFRSLESLGADVEYTRFEFEGSRFWSRGIHTGFLGLQVGWSPGSELPIYDDFTLGGFASLSGFAPDELRGQYLGVGRAGYYRKFWKTWYLGGWAELGNVWQVRPEADFDEFIPTGLLMLAKDTPFGPLYLAYGYAEEGNSKAYFVLGRGIR